MKLIFLRHAEAADSADSGGSDALRPLTDKGRKQMRKGARGLQQICPRIDVLAASPLLRAAQTAEMVAEVYGELKVLPCKPLSPGSSLESLLQWLRSQAEGTLVLVGHEPGLSLAASWLLGAKNHAVLQLGKGGACGLELGESPAPGNACLQWCLRPEQLRALR